MNAFGLYSLWDQDLRSGDVIGRDGYKVHDKVIADGLQVPDEPN
jgi:hypothetical protein